MFKKYPSLTNHYQNKDINYFEMKFGDEMKKVTWTLSEKIHGANFSILFQPQAKPEWFSRNNKITGDNFYNCEELIEEYVFAKLPIIQQFSTKTKQTVRLYGELYGPGIQKGVEYGNERGIKFFDMMVNDQFISQQAFEDFFFDHFLGSMLVPLLGRVPTLQDAINLDTRFNSKLSDKTDNIVEGVVIKPFEKVLVDAQGSLFYIKKKNDEFKEKQKVKKIRTVTNYTEEVNEYRAIFLSYINKNRVESVFSKEGEISSFKEIGKYISLIHKDALDDFKLDHDENFLIAKFTKQERKYIFNSSQVVVELLKTYL